MLDRRIALILLAVTLSSLASCAGPLFKVKPLVELPPLPDNSRRAETGGVTLRVAPLLSDEQCQELFEANLPLIGVLPVRLEMAFQDGAAVELKKIRFRVRDSQGREWKWLSTKKAVSSIMKGNGVSLYNPHSRKEFEREFAAYGIDLTSPLSSGASQRQGFLFFQSPDKQAVRRSHQLTLTIEKLPQPTSVALN